MKIALNREELLAQHVRSVSYNQQVAGFKVYDSLAAGWFGKDCWRIVNGWLTVDTLPDGSDHFPEIVILPLVLPSRVLNMGLPALGPATVKWSGNSTQGTDWLGRLFKAKLQVNGSGRPTGLSIEYPQEQPHAGRSLDSQIQYEYGSGPNDWSLPTKIKCGTNWEIEVVSVEFSKKPQAKSRFAYQPYVNRDSGLTVVSFRQRGREVWRMRYNDLADGMRRIGGVWVTKRQIRSASYFFFCIATASVVAVAIAKEKKKTKTKAVI